MKFNFKIQQYQTDAVDAVIKVFQGQGYHDRISYIRDVGKKQEVQQMFCTTDLLRLPANTLMANTSG